MPESSLPSPFPQSALFLLTGGIQGILLGILICVCDEHVSIFHTAALLTSLFVPLILYCVQSAPPRRQWRILAAAVAHPRGGGGNHRRHRPLSGLAHRKRQGSRAPDRRRAVVLDCHYPCRSRHCRERGVPGVFRWVESTLGALASLIVAGCTLAFFWILSGICFALFDTIGIIDFDWRGFWHFVLICASCVVFAGGVLLARREASRVSVLFSFFARLGGMLLEAVLAGEAAPERIPVDIIAVDKQPRFLRGNAR